MRIGLFLSSLPAYSETFILSKIHGLIKEGYDVRVFLANRSRQKTDYPYINPYPREIFWFVLIFPNIFLLLLLKRRQTLLRFISKEMRVGKNAIEIVKSIYINAHLLRARLDWLHFGFATFAIGRENVAASIGARMAVSLRGFDIGIYPLKHPDCYLQLWNVVNKIHTISDDLYLLALENGLSKEVPIQKIRPAILTHRLKAKSNIGHINDVCSIISIGRLEWKKGFIYALQAMKLLQQKGVKFMYKIAGIGAMEEELRYAIHDLQLEKHVQLMGKLPHEEVFNFLHKADIYIQPSVQEGFCNSLIEAQGTGLLSIATNAEGLPENILHGITGYIVNKRDPEALAAAIINVINSPLALRLKIAQSAIKRVNEEFDVKRLIKEFNNFYK